MDPDAEGQTDTRIINVIDIPGDQPAAIPLSSCAPLIAIRVNSNLVCLATNDTQERCLERCLGAVSRSGGNLRTAYELCKIQAGIQKL